MAEVGGGSGGGCKGGGGKGCRCGDGGGGGAAGSGGFRRFDVVGRDGCRHGGVDGAATAESAFAEARALYFGLSKLIILRALYFGLNKLIMTGRGFGKGFAIGRSRRAAANFAGGAAAELAEREPFAVAFGTSNCSWAVLAR